MPMGHMVCDLFRPKSSIFPCTVSHLPFSQVQDLLCKKRIKVMTKVMHSLFTNDNKGLEVKKKSCKSRSAKFSSRKVGTF